MRLFVFAFLFGCSALASFVEEPAGCWASKKFPCAMKSTEAKTFLSEDGFEVNFLKNTYVIFQKDSIRVLRGKVAVRSLKQNHLVLPVGRLDFQGNILVTADGPNKVHIKNLSAEARLSGKGYSKHENLPVGFENWYASMTGDPEKMEVERGMPRPFPAKDTVEEILVLCSRRSFCMKDISQYKDLWSSRTEVASEYYSGVVARRLASVEEKKNQERHRKQKLSDEKQQLRNMFREKNGL